MMRELLAFVVCLVSLAAVAAAPANVFREGRFPSGRTYSLQILESPFIPEKMAPDFWGAEGSVPSHCISTFRLVIDGKELTIPKRFYFDLCELNGGATIVERHDRRIRVDLGGGDAAGSFDVTYHFNVPREIQREVRSGELPDEIWERIIWHNDLYDPNYDSERPKKKGRKK